jgi:hypothetical protein
MDMLFSYHGALLATCLLMQARIGPLNGTEPENEGDQYEITKFEITNDNIIIVNRGVTHTLKAQKE